MIAKNKKIGEVGRNSLKQTVTDDVIVVNTQADVHIFYMFCTLKFPFVNSHENYIPCCFTLYVCYEVN